MPCAWRTVGPRIVRPATTYSYLHYQLVTLEAADTVGRARQGKQVVLPEQAREKPATLSWGGDAGRLIGGLLFRDGALGETFNINSAEHHTWSEIADYYHDICGLEAVWVDIIRPWQGQLFNSLSFQNPINSVNAITFYLPK